MTNTACHEAIELAAGPLVMTFDPAGAMLRYVRLGDVELVRGVFAAVRDQDWNTIPFSVHDFQHSGSSDAFALTFLVKCSGAGIQFDWRGKVTGTPDGVVRFDFRGEAKSTFLRNRIGLCVLHPIQDCVGHRCWIEHPDGTTTDTAFPKWISPHQPFKNIRSMTHNVLSGLQARVTFAGEVFETEDQRNWTDASFKTYGTPLELPFPVEISEGSRVDQSVTIESIGDVAAASALRQPAVSKESQFEVKVVVDWDDSRPMIPVGLSMATCGERATDDAIERLCDVKPSHLRVDLRLDRDGWQSDLHETITLASKLDSKLEIATFSAEIGDATWFHCLQELNEVRDRIARWLVFHTAAKSTPDAMATAASVSLREYSFSFPLVVGTDAYFAELNRNRPQVPGGCSVCYSINPQVHAFDNLSLCETLQAQRWTVDSAVEYFGRPVVISPITLRPRFNPNATSISHDTKIAKPETDSRQSSGFAAAWTVGVLAQLASHRSVESLTFFETFGPRGIIGIGGVSYPVAFVFGALRDTRSVFGATSQSPLEVAAVAMENASRARKLLLANMGTQQKTVCANDRDGAELRWSLDAESVRLVELESKQ